MRILSISSVPLLPHLGSGKTRLNWTEGLRKLGHTVDVLEPRDFEIWGRLKKAKQYRMAVGIFFKAKKQLQHSTYDLIEFYGSEYWLLLFWLKKIKKKKPLLVAHADGVELNDMDKAQLFWSKRKGFFKWVFDQTHYRFAHITFSLADRLVCGCQDDLKYVIERKYFSEQHAVCISPGIEESFHDLPFRVEKEQIIIFIGSWIERKGVKTIIPVINKILSLYPDYRFYVIGSGEQPETVQKQFGVSIRNRVKAFKQISLKELQTYALTAQVFFFPSYSEGFGLAIAEAMSCSCAALVTPTGIGSELINGTEALVSAFNDTITMEENLSFLIENNEKRIQIAYNGWLKAKVYQWEKQVKKLETVYNNWCLQ